MKYGFIEKAMWAGYKSTFKKNLTQTLDEERPSEIMKEAHKKYKDILADVTEFDKGDRFIINIVNCALLSSILLSVKKKYTVEQVREYYRRSMCDNALTQIASKKSRSYTPKGREILKRQAKESESKTNPYTWKFSVEDGETINQYTAYFYTCGICYLMRKLGLEEYIPAMCTLDYDMAELGNTEFTREYTLAGGGQYCDCHYNHRTSKK